MTNLPFSCCCFQQPNMLGFNRFAPFMTFEVSFKDIIYISISLMKSGVKPRIDSVVSVNTSTPQLSIT